MRHEISQRLTRLEESGFVRVNAERFIARSRRLARRKGVTLDAAMTRVVQELTDEELETVEAELEQIAFGSNTFARDAAKREALVAAGCPDWTGAKVKKKEEDGW